MSLQTAAALHLERAARRLGERLAELEERLQQDDGGAWNDYLATVNTLAAVLPELSPEKRGRLMTTAELAERIGIAPKTLLRRRKRGETKPAVVLGKRGSGALRWRGDEVTR